MHRYEISLSISANQYLDYYRGAVPKVYPPAPPARPVRFPPHINHA